MRKLLAEVEELGWTVHWVHVKGHLADGGNDKADERVQWGKEAGAYARLREGEPLRRCHVSEVSGFKNYSGDR